MKPPRAVRDTPPSPAATGSYAARFRPRFRGRIALGLSAIAYVVLLVVAGLGGIAAGMEHRRPGIAALRGLAGGAIFGVALLVGHWVLGRDATVALPSPEALEVLITSVASVPLALLGVALRRLLEARVNGGQRSASSPT